MNKHQVFVATIWIILFLLASAEITIAIINIGNTSCSNGALILPTSWLIVDGTVWIVGSCLTILCLFLLYCTYFDELFIMFIFELVKLFGGLFFFVWSMIGSVLVLRDNVVCEPRQLDDILWLAVATRIFLSVFTIFGPKNEINN